MTTSNLLPGEYPNSVPSEVLVSVCLITYNHAPYIRQAIDSVLSQETDFPFEICIGEDDSTDGTREICLEYAREYPDRIRLFLRKEEDKTYVNGKKTGKYNFIETRTAGRGKYIALLEGDDFWIDTKKLQRQADYLENNPTCHFVSARTLMLVEDGSNAQVFPNLETCGKLGYTDFFNTQLCHTSTICYRKDKINIREKIYSEVVNGDRLSAWMLLENGGYCYREPRVVSVYRVTHKGIWTSLNQTQKDQFGVMLWDAYKSRVPQQYKKFYEKELAFKKWLYAKNSGNTSALLKATVHLLRVSPKKIFPVFKITRASIVRKLKNLFRR